eukprot:m.37785 g.37785  ORF g.37785 m.37785 type:complete len:279 (-) comp17756_c0_seq2:85-921(-)
MFNKMFGKKSTQQQQADVDVDTADVAEELAAMRTTNSSPKKQLETPKCPFSAVRLNIVGSSHTKSTDTAELLNEIGGSAKLNEMAALFYSRMFADVHLDQFVHSHDDPHAERISDWIAEKMGGEGDIWTAKRMHRPRKVVELHGGQQMIVTDRSSAHYAAWNSTKRSPNVVGAHFKLPDSRNWLRLMLWSARDVGLLDNPRFADWYMRFLGHFVRIYASEAPQFVRESARWSTNPDNIKAYEQNKRYMKDVHVPYVTAIKDLPKEERSDYTDWPYEQE